MTTIIRFLQALSRFCANALSYQSEVEYARRCDDREPLTDDEFIKQYYANCNIPTRIPLRLRRLFSDSLGMTKVIPEDRFTQIMCDIDVGNFIRDIEDEFSVSIPEKEIAESDGSFQSLVQLIWEHSSAEKTNGST